MDKILTFQTQNEHGVFLYTIGEGRDHQYLTKTASANFHPEIQRYIDSAIPITGKTQLLLTALGAGEFYGSNVNGDFFPMMALKHEGADYGHKTFEMYAKAYKHHVNKDPAKSYGDVALSVWNDKMKRVELIIIVDNAKAPDIVERIDNGEHPEVSMGCCRASTPVLLSDFTEKPISECTADDYIIAGNGTIQKIAYPHSHHHNGTWFFVDIHGVNEEVYPTTEEHPWKVLPKEMLECSGNPKIDKNYIQNRHSWKRADELNVGDYVGTPLLKNKFECPESSLFVGFMGLYLANGYISLSADINLIVNNEEIPRILKKYSTLGELRVVPQGESSNASIISLYNQELARKLKKYFGGAHTKAISEDVLGWDKTNQLTLLGEYINGYGGVYKNSAYFSTCNKRLAKQVQAMLLRCDIISSLLTIEETIEYQVWVGSDTAYILSDFIDKGELLRSKNISDKRFIEDGYLWSPIVNIETEDCDEEVYNIAIESGDYDSDSYQVNGVALHNCKVPYDVCSICGNKAKTRAQYCDHLRYHMNKIPPGHTKKAYAINTLPRFFDISFVLIGADRIARVMKKVAHMHPQYGASSVEAAEMHKTLMEKRAFGLSYAKVAARKTAEIEKEVPSNTEPNTVTNIEHIGQRGIDALQPLEPDIPKKRIILITSMNPPGMNNLNRVLSTLGMVGIVPKPEEFQQIALRSLGRGHIADDLERRQCCFADMPFPPLERCAHYGKDLNIGYRHFDSDVFNLIRNIIPDRSYARPLLHKRVVRLVKLAEKGKLTYPMTGYVKKASAMFPEGEDNGREPFSPMTVMAALAGLYLVMKQTTPKATLSGMDKLIDINPGVAAALGIGAITGAKSLMSREVKGKYDLHPDHMMTPSISWQKDIERKNQHPIIKSAGRLSSTATRAFVGAPLIYIGSEGARVRRMRNPHDKESGFSSTLRQYPDLLSVGIVGEAALGSPITRKGMKGIKKGLSFLSKRASILDELKSTAIYSLAFPGSSLATRGTSWAIDQGIMTGIEKLLTHKAKKKPQGGIYA